MAWIITDKNFDPELIDSIEKGKNDVAKLQLKLISDQLLDLVDDTGSTILHYAVKFNNVIIVRYLVDLGCKYNVYNNDKNTPLMLAVMNNRMDLVKILLKRNQINFSDGHVRKLLEAMFERETRPEIVELVFQKLKKIDEKKIAKLLLDTKCPLYYAVFWNSVKIVNKIIDNGCSVNIKNPLDGNSPLHVAVAYGNLNLVQLLVEHGADVNAVNNKGEIPLNRDEEYCSREELSILKLLVEKESLLTSRDNSGRMQVSRLFQFRNDAIMEIILRSNIDLNVQDLDGDNVVHYFASNMETDISSLIIDRDFNPNTQNCWGFTPLYFAAFRHDLRAIKLLFDKGADVNIKSNGDIPPLHNLVITYKCGRNMSTDCVKEFIIEQGADIQYVHNNNFTIFDALRFYKDHELLDIILPHLALLEAQGTTIVEQLRQKIDSTDWIKSGIESYRSMLEQLKIVEVYESVTIFNLLIDSERRIINYLRNNQLATKIRCILNSKNHGVHWWYFEVLKKRVNNALDIVEWQQKAANVFCTVVGNHFRFADFIINEVMVYLSLQDIKNLASVKCPDQNTSKRKKPLHSRKSSRKRKCQ